MDDSGFRLALEYLRKLRGHHRRLEWPQLLRWQIAQEFERVRHSGEPYGGPHVFKDRDSEAWRYETHPKPNDERVAVYRLYREVHANQGGCIVLRGRRVWLVSCQVPNQEKEKGRRADLVGLRSDGSLVVFECKVGTNTTDTPFSGLVEGLDYLSHLLIRDNLDRFNEGLRKWVAKPRSGGRCSVVPVDFEGLDARSESRHAVVVLAPRAYFAEHRKAVGGIDHQWHLLSDRSWPREDLGVELDFALTEFCAGPCDVLDVSLPTQSRRRTK